MILILTSYGRRVCFVTSEDEFELAVTQLEQAYCAKAAWPAPEDSDVTITINGATYIISYEDTDNV